MLLRGFWLALTALEGKVKSLPSKNWVQEKHWIFETLALKDQYN